ncbi:hypothetical protein QGX11_gp106 [Pseudomonas phage PPSC2]|uniref:Uncharacterized protein n=1 Tax=Pseudomonas phage PPSC2 TaxID=2041350 RepID=A0A2R2YB51_9CAUD|nr:hypothetical protein QGX11_gp106 [Pseudomonas phage PPSC2]ATN92869.1 hypothetical protein PPSC2_106 [Pseudomonas phage PPSC2]
MQAVLKYAAFYTEYDRTVTVYKLDDGRYQVVVSHEGVDTPGSYDRTFLSVTRATEWAKTQL